MATFSKTLRTGMAAALLLAGITTSAQALVPGGGATGFGAGGRSMTIIKGTVLCVGCNLEEVHKAQPDKHHLYQLSHKQGRAVMQVRSINGSSMWDSPWPPRLSVRAKDSVFQQLTAEKNLTKDVEITGILSNSTRTLDIFTVTISG
jgi:hypothetical protein